MVQIQISDQNRVQPDCSEQPSSSRLSQECPPLQPLLFTPILKRTCWGGSRLGEVLHKPIGAEGDYAESWEIVDLPQEQSKVALGPHAGWTVSQLRKQYQARLLGAKSTLESIPLLVKFLDIQGKLSIQVHPDDHQAFQLTGGSGKTETWIILEAEPDSILYAGIKEGIDRDQFEKALACGNVATCLHAFAVQAGDAVHIPAGTVHAVKGSVLLAEVQQASDLSFRFHDWDRHHAGEPRRELHVEEGLLCTNFEQGPVQVLSPRVTSKLPHREEVVIDCPHYTIHRHQATTPFVLQQQDRFRILVILEGEGELETVDFNEKTEPGQTWLIPACCQKVTLKPASGMLSLLDVFVGQR